MTCVLRWAALLFIPMPSLRSLLPLSLPLSTLPLPSLSPPAVSLPFLSLYPLSTPLSLYPLSTPPLSIYLFLQSIPSTPLSLVYLPLYSLSCHIPPFSSYTAKMRQPAQSCRGWQMTWCLTLVKSPAALLLWVTSNLCLKWPSVMVSVQYSLDIWESEGSGKICLRADNSSILIYSKSRDRDRRLPSVFTLFSADNIREVYFLHSILYVDLNTSSKILSRIKFPHDDHMAIPCRSHDNHIAIPCRSHDDDMAIPCRSHDNHIAITWWSHEVFS